MKQLMPHKNIAVSTHSMFACFFLRKSFFLVVVVVVVVVVAVVVIVEMNII